MGRSALIAFQDQLPGQPPRDTARHRSLLTRSTFFRRPDPGGGSRLHPDPPITRGGPCLVSAHTHCVPRQGDTCSGNAAP